MLTFGSISSKMVHLPQQNAKVVAALETPHDHDRSTLEVPGMSSLLSPSLRPQPCKVCSAPTPNRRAKFCSQKCREIGQSRPLRPSQDWGVSHGTIGAVAEMLTCADLLKRGYEVFRAVSPTCSCDLIAMKKGSPLRVEVRTGSVLRSGRIHVPYATSDMGRHDVLAIVINAEKVLYFPDLLTGDINGEVLTDSIATRLREGLLHD